MVRNFGGAGRAPQSLKHTVKYCSSIGALVRLMSKMRMIASWQNVIRKGLFDGPAFNVALESFSFQPHTVLMTTNQAI